MNSVPKQVHTISLLVSALSALQRKGVVEVSDLALFTEIEISNLNGVGTKALAVLRDALNQHNMCFKKTK